MRTGLALALALLSTAAGAGEVDPVFGIVLPPARYDSGPLPVVVIYRDTEAAVSAKCDARFPPAAGSMNAGCTIFTTPTQCNVYIISDIDDESHGALLRHELAHCRGWPPHHPD